MTRSRPHLVIVAAALFLALVTLGLRSFECREPTHGEEQSSIPTSIEMGRSSTIDDGAAPSARNSSGVSRVPLENDREEPGIDAKGDGGSWHLAVSGVVEDAKYGRPLSGVTVWIDRFSSSDELADEALERSWDDRIHGREWSDDVERSLMRRPHRVVTDGAGKFVIDGLPAGRVRLRASKTNYEIMRATTELTRVGGRTRLIASPKRVLTLTVRLPDGSIADTARLQMIRGNWKHEEDWFAEDPTVLLAEGTYDLLAIAKDPLRDSWMRSQVQRITIRESQAPIELVLELVGSIRLNVVGWSGGSGGDTWRSACVRSGLIPAGTPNSDIESLCESLGVRSGEDLEATARFDLLAPGSYDVFVFPFRDLPYFLEQSCEVEQAPVGLEFHLDRIALPTALSGTIRCLQCENESRFDAPCVDSLRVTASVGDSTYELEAAFFRGYLPDGRTLIVPRLDDWRSLGAGTGPDSLTIWARSSAHGRGRATLPANSQPFAIELGRIPSASLTIAVRDVHAITTTANRALVARVVPTSIAGIDLNGDLGTRVTLVSEGIAVLDRLDPGEYTVTLTEAGRGSIEDLGVTLATQAITVTGNSRVEFAVPQLYSVDLVVGGALESADVQLTELGRGGGARRLSFITVGEVTRIDALPAGRYAIDAWGEDSDDRLLAASAEFEIPKQSSIRLDLRESNCVRVRITDPKGWLFSKGLREGDAILDRDGVDFDWDFGVFSGPAFMRAWSSARRWTVLRSGGEHVVELPREAAGITWPLGGVLSPSRVDR